MADWERGLTSAEASAQRARFGRNSLALHKASIWTVLWRQINNPLLLILVVTIIISYFFDDRLNAGIIFAIMSLGVGLGFINEYSSEKTVTGLLEQVSLSSLVIRDGVKQEIPVEEVVIGDTVLLHLGTVVPADLDIVASQDLSIDESVLTGESIPVAKQFTSKEPEDGWAFMRTVVVGGTGAGVVKTIGQQTSFGRLARRVTEFGPKTAFQEGLAQLSTLITRVIISMAVVVGILNIGLGKDPLQAVLFALAVAIGLTPALLPMIVAIAMSQGARRMAKKNVVVKKLMAIEDLGNMEILCTDKTGTLTEGEISLVDYYNMRGERDQYILQMALACNTAVVHHKIIGNPMDVAIWQYAQEKNVHLQRGIKKIVEEEFNFDYRGEFTVIERAEERLCLFKGAPDSVLDRCSTYRDQHGHLVTIGASRKALREKFHILNNAGLRLIAVAQGSIETKEYYDFKDAKDLELLGYITFLDVPKESAQHALDNLANLGVEVKILTGDNEIVTNQICESIGFSISKIITGAHFERMHRVEKQRAVREANVFARVSPDQKEEIITLLRKSGKVVGYLGDGVNDAAALHAADVSISVNSAVDVAKDIAGIVLLRKGLDVIADGVCEGRRIFANTLKYILMGTSSNFGNMFSMAGVSFFLPFLPMTPSQILLNNSLYDISQLALPSDQVDAEVLLKPHHWNVQYIYRHMLWFGPISSLFDYLSFIILWFGFHAGASQFQTGWFLQSIATQILVVFIIRTKRSPFWKSRASSSLIVVCSLVVLVAFLIPFTPLAPLVNLTPLPGAYYLILILQVILYLGIVEIVKSRFLRQLEG